MVLFIVCVRDSATQAYGRPFFVNALGQALRSFSDEINNPEGGDLHRHPSDFELYHIGVYDDQLANLEPTQPPVLLARGKDCVQPAKA